LKRVDAVWTIAREELAGRVRNRWIWTVSVLVLITSLTVAFLGSVSVGVIGARGSEVVMASLLNLAVYLVPLLALVMGAGVIIDEKQRGILDVFLVCPVSSAEYFLGKFVGYVWALSIALLASFVPTGILLVVTTAINPTEYLLLLLLVLSLGVVFLAISFFISILSRDHARGVGLSILVWVLSVFVYDLALVGGLVLYQGEISPTVFGAILLLNPIDIFRLLALSWVGSAASPLGLGTVAQPFPVEILAGFLVLWGIVPLWLSHRLFQTRLAKDRLL